MTTVRPQIPKIVLPRESGDGRVSYDFGFDYQNDSQILVQVGPSENWEEWITIINGVNYGLQRIVNGGRITIFDQGYLDTLFPDESFKYLIISRMRAYQQERPIPSVYDRRTLDQIAEDKTYETQQLNARISVIENIPGISDPLGTIVLPNERNRLPKIWNDEAKNKFKGSNITDDGTLVRIGSNTTVVGLTTTTNLTVISLAQINDLNATDATIGTAIIDDADVHILKSDSLTVSGTSDLVTLNVSDDALIEGDLTVLGTTILGSIEVMNITCSGTIDTQNLIVHNATTLDHASIVHDMNIAGNLLANTAHFSGDVTVDTEVAANLIISDNILSQNGTIGNVFNTNELSAVDFNVYNIANIKTLSVDGVSDFGGDIMANNVSLADLEAISIESGSLTVSGPSDLDNITGNIADIITLNVTTLVFKTNASFYYGGVTFKPNWLPSQVVNGGIFTFQKGDLTGDDWYIVCSPAPSTGGGGSGNVNVGANMFAIGGATTDSVVSGALLQRGDDIATTMSLTSYSGLNLANNSSNFFVRQVSPTSLTRTFTVELDYDQYLNTGTIASLYLEIDQNDSSRGRIVPNPLATPSLNIVPPWIIRAPLIWVGFTSILDEKDIFCDQSFTITSNIITNANIISPVTIRQSVNLSMPIRPITNSITINPNQAAIFSIVFNDDINTINLSPSLQENQIINLLFTNSNIESSTITWPNDWLWPNGLAPKADFFAQGKSTWIDVRKINGLILANYTIANIELQTTNLAIFGSFMSMAPLAWVNFTGKAMYASFLGFITGDTIQNFDIKNCNIQSSSNAMTTIAIIGGVLTLNINSTDPMVFIFTRDSTVNQIVINKDPALAASHFYLTLVGLPGTSSQTLFPLPTGCLSPDGLQNMEWDAGTGFATFYCRPAFNIYIPTKSYEATVLFSGSMMNNITYSDTPFPISNCVAPSSSTANSLVYGVGTDGNGDLILGSSNIIIDSNGDIATPITINRLLNQSIFNTEETIVASTGTTSLSLLSANTFIITRSSNTTLMITDADPTKMIPFVVILVKDNSVNQYTVAFGPTWYKEGGQELLLTNTSGGIDIVVGIAYGGAVYTDVAINNYSAVSGFQEVMARRFSSELRERSLVEHLVSSLPGVAVEDIFKAVQPIFSNITIDPKIRQNNYIPRIAKSSPIYPESRNVTPNSLCACSATGEVVTTDIAIDGDTTITSPIVAIGCQFNSINCPVVTINPDPTITIDPLIANFFVLTVSQNTTISISALPPTYQTTVRVLLVHDNTSNSYTITLNGVVTDQIDVLTNTPGARDLLIFSIIGSTTYALVRNNYS